MQVRRVVTADGGAEVDVAKEELRSSWPTDHCRRKHTVCAMSRSHNSTHLYNILAYVVAKIVMMMMSCARWDLVVWRFWRMTNFEILQKMQPPRLDQRWCCVLCQRSPLARWLRCMLNFQARVALALKRATQGGIPSICSLSYLLEM